MIAFDKKNINPQKTYEAMLQLLQTAETGFIIARGIPLKIVFINKALCKLIGYTQKEVLGMSALKIMSLVHTEDRKIFFRRYLDRLSGKKLKPLFEVKIVCKNGAIKNFIYQAKKITWQNTPAIQASFTDITERKKVERELSKTINWFKLIYNSGRDALITITAPTWRFADANEQVKNMFGVKSLKEFLKFTPWELSPKRQPDGQLSKTKAKTLIKKALTKGSIIFNWTHQRADGRTFPAEVHLTKITYNDKTLIQSRVIDLTQEKENLSQINQFQLAMNSSLVEVAFAKNNGEITYCNNAWAKNHGYNTPKEIIGKNLVIFHPTSELGKIKAALKKISKNVFFVGEIVHQRKNGTTYLALMKNTLLTDEQGAKIYLAVAHDISREQKQTQALTKEQEWSKKLIEEAPHIVLGLNEQFKIVLCNKKLENLLGYNKKQLIGKTWPNIAIPRHLRPTIWNVWKQIVKEKKIDHHFVNPIVNHNKQIRLISWHNQSIQENGAFKMVLSFGEDITDESAKDKIAGEKQQKLNSLFASLPNIVFELDPDGIFTFYHGPKNGKLYTDPKYFMGKKYSTIMPPNVSAQIDNAILKNKKGVAFEFEYPLLMDGKELWFEAIMNPVIFDNKYAGSVAVIREITKEREVDRMKTEFVSLASHQLRTPITGINWNCELLLDNKKESLTESQTELVKEIQRGNTRMIQLVNALLNVARLEMGTVMVTPKELLPKDVCLSIIDQYQHQIEKNNLKVTETCDPKIKKIKADPKLLGIIFENLFSNAVKYSNPGETIKIQTKRKKSNMIISVSNKGIPIPPAQKEKMFTKLFRTDEAQLKDPDGSGLGLYIIKLILSQCGGDIWYTSTAEGKTTFYVKIPISGMRARAGSKPLI